jgi:hypothetical protein
LGALTEGGGPTLLWGYVVVALGSVALACSLAEMSRYVTHNSPFLIPGIADFIIAFGHRLEHNITGLLSYLAGVGGRCL